MCWNPKPGKEVFDSEKASDIAVDLCFKIADEIEKLHCGCQDHNINPNKTSRI